MIAKLAYITTPQAGVVVINIQPEGSNETIPYEISKAHLANILIDGCALALRDQYPHRVSVASQTTENANERAEHRT